MDSSPSQDDLGTILAFKGGGGGGGREEKICHLPTPVTMLQDEMQASPCNDQRQKNDSIATTSLLQRTKCENS